VEFVPLARPGAQKPPEFSCSGLETMCAGNRSSLPVWAAVFELLLGFLKFFFTKTQHKVGGFDVSGSSVN
jgi:hypothetical protein